MTRAVAAEPRRSGRLVSAVLVVFALQVAALIFLGSDSRPTTGTIPSGPVFHWGMDRGLESAMVEDPTLFVLPHAQTVSGDAWMRIPRQEFHFQKSEEPLRWLELPRQELGASFVKYVRSHVGSAFDFIEPPRPTEIFPLVATLPLPPRPSSLRIDGDLAGRPLLNKPVLPSWSSTNLLTNTVVRVWVDPRGFVFSAITNGPGSGLEAANLEALRIAQASRFKPIEPDGPDRDQQAVPEFTVGDMIFEWQLAPVTNTAPVVVP